MSYWRKVVDQGLAPTLWRLQLECGHEAFRSAQYTVAELPRQVLCQACKSLIGSQIKAPTGKMGTIARYGNGQFDIAWQNDGVSRSTLDELREKLEIL